MDKDHRINKVYVRGRVVRKYRDYETSRELVEVFIKDRNRDNTIKFICEDPEVSKDIHRGDHVFVVGFSRSFRYFDKVFQRNRSVSYFVAESIEKDTTMIEKYFGNIFENATGQFFEKPFFRAEISGTVYAVINNPKTPNWETIVVRTRGGGIDKRDSTISIGCYKEPSKSRFAGLNLEQGDEVAILASISTKDKIEDGRTIHRENLNLEDLFLVKKADADRKAPVAVTHAPVEGVDEITPDAMEEADARFLSSSNAREVQVVRYDEPKQDEVKKPAPVEAEVDLDDIIDSVSEQKEEPEPQPPKRRFFRFS